MAAARPNVGSAALSAFLMHRAGLPDPVDLLGAMFIIEGLGAASGQLAARLQPASACAMTRSASCATTPPATTPTSACWPPRCARGLDDAAVAAVVATARVTARLYALQLEELGNA